MGHPWPAQGRALARTVFSACKAPMTVTAASMPLAVSRQQTRQEVDRRAGQDGAAEPACMFGIICFDQY